MLAQKVRLIELVPAAAVPDRFQLGRRSRCRCRDGPAQILVLSGHSTEVAAVTTSASFGNRRAVEFFVKIGIDEIVGIDKADIFAAGNFHGRGCG